MANMGYVRFENTYRDLQDCFDYLWNDNLSESEEKHRKRLIKLCQDIADEAADFNEDPA